MINSRKDFMNCAMSLNGNIIIWKKPYPIGWQPWEGGDYPIELPWNLEVFVMRRNGKIEKTFVKSVRWFHFGNGYYGNNDLDILAYRVA